MHALVRTVFSRLHHLDPEIEEAKLDVDDEEAEIKMSVSSTQIHNQIGSEEVSQETAVDASVEEQETKGPQTPPSAVVTRSQCMLFIIFISCKINCTYS